MANTLPVSRLISSSVNLSPSAAQSQNLSTLLIVGSSSVINTIERFRIYGDIDDIASDYGTIAPEYLAAVLAFEQAPQPTQLCVGRWAKTATSGQLIGGTLSTAQQAIANFTAIAAGALNVTVDGTIKSLTAINLSAVTNLNAVAAAITTKLAGAGTVIWNANYSRFEFTSATTGVTSTLTYASAPGTGTDLSVPMGIASTSSGAYIVAGVAAETALAATALFDAQFGQQWYGLTICGAVDADHVAVASYIEATTTKHVYGVTTQEAGVLVATDTTNIAYQLKALGLNKTMVSYSSSNPYAVVSMMSRILTTDYNQNNSVITLMYKQEPGIVAESLNTTQVTALEGFNCNVYTAYDNGTAIIEPGVVSSGEYIDTIVGVDNFAVDLQTAEFNLLYTSTTKIPQTDPGTHLIVTTAEQVCVKYVTAGLFAPGTWEVGGFGALSQGDFMPKGFYVYAAPISTQSVADRKARKSVPIQIAAKLAGAIHKVNLAINVNQ